nr:MAG TPA: hypothetical protein [Caudoviricetes sp.]
MRTHEARVYTIAVHHCSTGWGWGPCLFGRQGPLHIMRITPPHPCIKCMEVRILVSSGGTNPLPRQTERTITHGPRPSRLPERQKSGRQIH